MKHQLKTWPGYFHAVKTGVKTFEIRKDDRKFNVGDTLVLNEFVPCPQCHGSGREQIDAWDACACDCGDPHGKFTGKKVEAKVTYLTDFGQPSGQIVMAIKLIP